MENPNSCHTNIPARVVFLKRKEEKWGRCRSALILHWFITSVHFPKESLVSIASFNPSSRSMTFMFVMFAPVHSRMDDVGGVRLKTWLPPCFSLTPPSHPKTASFVCKKPKYQTQGFKRESTHSWGKNILHSNEPRWCYIITLQDQTPQETTKKPQMPVIFWLSEQLAENVPVYHLQKTLLSI